MGSHKRWVQRGNSGNFVKWETEGQTLEGRVLGIRDGKFGEVCDLDTDEGRVTFPIQTALALLFENASIKVGDEIRVVYIGRQVNPKTGNEFKNFELYTAEIEGGDPGGDPSLGGPDDDIPFN